MRFFLVIIAFLLSLNIFAQETALSIRTYTNSCGYFSNFSADFKITLIDPSLPRDAEVKLIYGLGNSEERIDWQSLRQIKTKKITPEEREAQASVVLTQRGYPERYNTLQFVWEITLASGEVYYIKGNNSHMGFFEAVFTSIHESQCISSMKEKPLYRKVPFETVSR